MAALVSVIWAGAGAGPAIYGGKKKDATPPPKPDRPTLTLQASPRHGFLPLSVTLYGRLEGIERGDTRFCDAGVEWTGETGLGKVMRSTEDAKCIHPPEASRIEHSYTKVLYLDKEGIFRYQLVLHTNDGKLLKSNTVDIRTISAR